MSFVVVLLWTFIYIYIYEHNTLKRGVHYYNIITSELIVLRIKVLE